MDREDDDEKEEEVAYGGRDGQVGVHLSVPVCLLQPLPLLQHVM